MRAWEWLTTRRLREHLALPERAKEALQSAWECPFSVSSNFARQYALEVAFLASRGWLSVIGPDGSYSRLWRITSKGQEVLGGAREEHP